MKLLVLSYDTLPGTAASLTEEARERGLQVECVELKSLMSQSKRSLSRRSRFVQSAKELLGAVYKAYDPLDYTFITALTHYINESDIDTVICTDAYSVKVMSLSKQAGLDPLCYAVISDYEAATLSNPTLLDGYFIAQEELKYYMIRHGIGSDRLYNYGLPIPKSFRRTLGKWAARNYLFIPQNKRVYLVLTGGMGYDEVTGICSEMLDAEDEDFLLYILLPRDSEIGGMGYDEVTGICSEMLDAEDEDFLLYILLPRDSEIRDRLEQKYKGRDSIRVIALTRHLNIYMEGADAVLSHPKAFESYEAAAVGAPLVHILPPSGAERRIAEFFADREMSLKAASIRDSIAQARRLAREKAVAERMRHVQSRYIRGDASQRIMETILKKTDYH